MSGYTREKPLTRRDDISLRIKCDVCLSEKKARAAEYDLRIEGWDFNLCEQHKATVQSDIAKAAHKAFGHTEGFRFPFEA